SVPALDAREGRMKTVLIGVVLAMAAAPVLACNSEMLVVQDWQASANEGNRFFPVSLSAAVKYQGPRPYRMIHAGVIFADVLGANLGQVNLNKDQEVAPGDIVDVDGLVDAKE